jgi:hypothetical protein
LSFLTLSCSGNSAAVHSLTKRLEYVSVYFHRTALVSTSNHLQLYGVLAQPCPPTLSFHQDLPTPARSAIQRCLLGVHSTDTALRSLKVIRRDNTGLNAPVYNHDTRTWRPYTDFTLVILFVPGGTNNVNNNRMFLIQPYRTTTDLCSTQCHCEHVVPSTDDSHPAMGEQRPDRSSPSGGTSGSWLQSLRPAVAAITTPVV